MAKKIKKMGKEGKRCKGGFLEKGSSYLDNTRENHRMKSKLTKREKSHLIRD